MGIVYAVINHYWQRGVGDDYDYSNDEIDSLWSRKEDAKRRVDDLANEHIRREWHYQLVHSKDFILNEVWNDDRTAAKFSVDDYEETDYFIKELKVDPVLEDFEGP